MNLTPQLQLIAKKCTMSIIDSGTWHRFLKIVVDQLQQAGITMKLKEKGKLKLQYVNFIQTLTSLINNNSRLW